jgi:hypothetical protein
VTTTLSHAAQKSKAIRAMPAKEIHFDIAVSYRFE